ncbi:hypothetical protein PMO01_28335 [Pseudomonas moraviensis R28-S]|uniref:Uncharacterized protein n=1 Tax=Pseudomonas moraviensis R28-S TaxID=1395516 RepID=V8R2X8_9PSED|nr:hypothetical protein PMO01_28335 [Pseudomonas moraviensis R28-S]
MSNAKHCRGYTAQQVIKLLANGVNLFNWWLLWCFLKWFRFFLGRYRENWFRGFYGHFWLFRLNLFIH